MNKWLTLGLTGGALLLSGCGKKSCKCYLFDQWGTVHTSKTYIDEDTPCADLGYSTMRLQDSSYRLCTEAYEPDMDYGDVAHMFDGSQNENQ